MSQLVVFFTTFLYYYAINALEITCQEEPTIRNISLCASIEYGYSVDVVILVDISCPMTTTECKSQQEQISYALQSFKGIPIATDGSSTDVAYIEFDGITTYPIINLTESPYNTVPITKQDLSAYFNLIKQRNICDDTSQRNENPDLLSALNTAFEQFEDAGSYNKRRDTKILIFSNCRTNNIDIICQEHETEIFAGNRKYSRGGTNIVMVNNGDEFDDNNNDYIMCLVEYDENRIFVNSKYDENKYYDEILPMLQSEICSHPTPSPTPDPTKEPTSNPTTIAPTISIGPEPTRDIEQCSSMKWNKVDIVILNDISCPLNETQCIDEQEQIAYALKAIKGTDFTSGVNSNVAYIEFDGVNVNPIVSLNDDIFNTIPVTEEDIDEYFYKIKNSDVCNDISQRNGNPNLEDAIDAALQQFQSADSNNKRRDMKVLIFSNCKVDNIENICNKYEDDIFESNKKYGGGSFFDAVMVNNGDEFDEIDDQYIMCLVEYDELRLFTNTARDNDKYYNEILPKLQNSMCNNPTPAPTMDPTKEPTKAPQQSRRLRNDDDNDRRGLQGEFDITSGISNNSPCITLEIKLETENLLPTNNDPDPASNIFIIGKALANVTEGILTIPDIPDPDLEDDDPLANPEPIIYDPQYVWDVDDSCLDNTQINDNYFPKGEYKPGLNATVIINTDRFKIIIPFTTTSSVVYIFQLNELPLQISHSCSSALTIIGAIYQNDNLINKTETISIPPNETGDDRKKQLPFDSILELESGRDYEIIFESVNTFPTGCTFNDNINIGSSGFIRRRMTDSDNGYFSYDDFKATANPNACTLGAALAQSNAMKTGIAAMCNKNLGDNRKVIESGLFQFKSSMNAIRNHLVKPGSLYVLDENGNAIFSNTEWPANKVKKPCIAIDEDTNRIFAIGGFIKPLKNAVDSIQVWKFTDNTLLTGAPVSELDGWVLDKPRYGSMCFYWKKSATEEALVVLSGMENQNYELTDKSKFFNDIRIFPIPKDANQLNLWLQKYGKKSYSSPQSGTKYVGKKGLIDSRPLLYDNHILYSFGGKTHLESKGFVTRFDLNDIENDNAASVETMSLSKQKAAPIIDRTKMNVGSTSNPLIKDCYMIFSGQTYNKTLDVDGSYQGMLITDGISTDNLQLFCNPQINVDGKAEYDPITVERRRRRLNEENIITLSEYDRFMLDEGKRRRLIDDENENEILIRDYEYGLDGIWYNFTVKFEICYNNNNELYDAKQFYLNAIQSKPNGDEWINYAIETGDSILNESLIAYYGWSNGFGAVNVWDLDVLDVNPEITPTPTKLKRLSMSHPQRRKARFWGHNIEDRASQSDMWIDGKFKNDKGCNNQNNENEKKQNSAEDIGLI